MTTIVYRDGILASDTRAGWGDFMSPQRMRKIWDVGSALVGISGDISYLQPLIRYAEKGGDKPWSNDEARGLIITKDQVRMVGAGGDHVIDAPFVAIGSGAPAAFAALYMGADAKRAVEIAALIDPFTGGPIDVLWLGER